MRDIRNIHWKNWIGIWMWQVVLGAMIVSISEPASAANPESPRQLPHEAVRMAQPIDVGAQARQGGHKNPQEAAGEQLWRIIDKHQDGDLTEAVLAWNALGQSTQFEPWRSVAMAAAQLELGELQAARATLKRASAIDNNNALVHYYSGLLRLEQAIEAFDWEDAVGPRLVRTVAYLPDDVHPNSKSVYQLAAARHFETALELADRVEVYQSLLGIDSTTPGVAPRVIDLMQAIGADHYEANCHILLGEHYLRATMLETAEYHLDQARKLSFDMTLSYRQLATEYEALGRFADAARAHAKDLQCGSDVARPLKEMVRTLRQAMIDGI